MTLGIDIGVLKIIITHAAAVHGLDISPDPVDLARVALKRLGLIGKGTERDRRPTTDELNQAASTITNSSPPCEAHRGQWHR